MGLVQYIMDSMYTDNSDDFEDDYDEGIERHDKLFRYFDHLRSVEVRQAKDEIMQVVMIQAESIEDAQKICDQLMEGKVTIINMDRAARDQQSRILDFMAGAIYVINGNILLISDAIYMAAPAGIELTEGSHKTNQIS